MNIEESVPRTTRGSRRASTSDGRKKNKEKKEIVVSVPRNAPRRKRRLRFDANHTARRHIQMLVETECNQRESATQQQRATASDGEKIEKFKKTKSPQQRQRATAQRRTVRRQNRTPNRQQKRKRIGAIDHLASVISCFTVCARKSKWFRSRFGALTLAGRSNDCDFFAARHARTDARSPLVAIGSTRELCRSRVRCRRRAGGGRCRRVVSRCGTTKFSCFS